MTVTGLAVAQAQHAAQVVGGGVVELGRVDVVDEDVRRRRAAGGSSIVEPRRTPT